MLFSPFVLASSNLGRCSSLLSRVSCARSSLTKIPGAWFFLHLWWSFLFASNHGGDGPWTSQGASCSILLFCRAGSTLGSLSRLSFSLSISFTMVSVLSQVSAPSSRMPSSRILLLHLWFSRYSNLISVVIQGTAHLFNLFFDLMQSGWAWFQVLDFFLGELKAHLQVASVFLGNI